MPGSTLHPVLRRARATSRAVTIAVAMVALVASTTVAAAAGRDDPGRPDWVLPEDMQGEEAIRALGDRLPEVAATNGMTAAEFRQALREEEMLWVGRSGILLFVDEVHEAPASEGPETAALAEAPLSDTFLLHSRPGASRVLYLDFDGHDASGTAWDNGTADVNAQPYDADGDPTSFSDTERATIQSIWRRVAEDYAPFAVDVTTEDPGSAAITRSGAGDALYGTRVVVTPTWAYDCTCGGVAYVGTYDITSYHAHYQPAWVFTGGVGIGAKNIAEAASHEAGHNLGLYHDGTATSGYYTGHGNWAPIMGVGYYEPITQWSAGEYDGASNGEDDLTIIQQNGAPLMVDDHGDTPSSATPVGPSFSVNGLISTGADVDAFSFNAGAGTVTLDAVGADPSPDLDIELTLLDGAGSIVAIADPASSASSGRDTPAGLGASLQLDLPADTYTVLLDGVGYGDPGSTGYSDYGSLGRYVLSGSYPDGGSNPPPENQSPTAEATVSPGTTGQAPYSVTLSGAGSSDPENDPLSFTWVEGAQVLGTGEQIAHTFTETGEHVVQLTVSDGTSEDVTSVTVTVTAPTVETPPPTAPTSVTATFDGSAVAVSWLDADHETSYEVVRERWHKRGVWHGTTLVAVLTAGTTAFSESGLSDGTYRYIVRAVNTAGTAETASSAVDVVSSGGGGGKGGGNGRRK